jgi:hypothetical protein
LNQFSLLVYLLLLVKETTTIARPLSFASNATEKFPVVVSFGRRAPASAKTSVNACDTEIHTRKKIRVFLCRQKTLKSLAFVFGQTQTHMRHSQTISSLSLSLFFLPSAQTAKRRRRREKEEEEISRKKRCLDDEEEQRLRPVAFGWCER